MPRPRTPPNLVCSVDHDRVLWIPAGEPRRPAQRGFGRRNRPSVLIPASASPRNLGRGPLLRRLGLIFRLPAPRTGRELLRRRALRGRVGRAQPPLPRRPAGGRGGGFPNPSHDSFGFLPPPPPRGGFRRSRNQDFVSGMSTKTGVALYQPRHWQSDWDHRQSGNRLHGHWCVGPASLDARTSGTVQSTTFFLRIAVNYLIAEEQGRLGNALCRCYFEISFDDSTFSKVL